MPTAPAAEKSDAIDLKPLMGGSERACLERLLAGCSRYLEFGCGGSTLLAVRANIASATSVDSSAGWLAKVHGHPEIAAAEAEGRLRLHHADIGPVGGFGTPVGTKAAHAWPRYYRDIWETIASPELVFIDGRFRVACALSALMRSTATLVIHDFWRPYYHAVLEFVDVVERVESLAVLKPRRLMDWRAFGLAVEAHALDHR